MPKRGVTLAEMMVTMLLVLLIFSAIQSLFHGYSEAMRFQAGKDLSVEAAQTAIDPVRTELSEAVSVDASAMPTRLVFTKIDPNFTPPWLPPAPDLSQPPTVPPGSGAADWNPYPAAKMLRITYRKAGEVLVRECLPAGGTATVTNILPGVQDFAVARLANGNVEVRITVQETKKLHTVAAQAKIWTEP